MINTSDSCTQKNATTQPCQQQFLGGPAPAACCTPRNELGGEAPGLWSWRRAFQEGIVGPEYGVVGQDCATISANFLEPKKISTKTESKSLGTSRQLNRGSLSAEDKNLKKLEVCNTSLKINFTFLGIFFFF